MLTATRQVLFSGTATGLRDATLANVITDATRRTAVEGDGLSVPGGFGIWPAATNSCDNGGLETNTTKWLASFSTETISRVTTRAKFGLASGLCTVVALGQAGALWASGTAGMAVVVGNTYTSSIWGYLDSGTPTGNFRAAIVWWTAAGAFISRSDGTAAALTAAWQRFSCTAVAPATAAFASVVLFRDNATVESFAFNFDGAQIEDGAIATPYIETDGGTAARSAARVTVPTQGLFTATQGWWAMGVNPGATINMFAIAEWGDDGNNHLLMYADAGGLHMSRIGGAGTGAQSTTAISFTLSTPLRLIGAWDSTRVRSSTAGAAFDNTAQTNIPTLTDTVWDIGYAPINSSLRQISSNIQWEVVGKGVLTDADAVTINSWGSTVPTLSQIAQLSAASKPTLLIPAKTADAVLLPAYFGGTL